MKLRNILGLASALVLAVSVPAAASYAPAEDGSVLVTGVVEVMGEGSDYYSWYPAGDRRAIQSCYWGDNEGYTLLNEKGEKLNETPYYYMQELGGDAGDSNFYYVSQEDTLNGFALMDQDGNLLTEFKYGALSSLSDDWKIGYVGVVSEDPEPDFYSNSSEPCKISEADVYYRGELVGTLTRNEIANTYSNRAFGAYLITSGPTEGEFFCFDKDLNLINTLHSYAYDGGVWSGEEYYTEDYVNYIHVSGVPAFTPECPLMAEDVEMPYHVGQDEKSIVDLQGNTVAELPFSIYNLQKGLNDTYLFNGGENYDEGVLDGNFQVLAEPEYSSIGDWWSGYSLVNGYVRLEKNNQFAYLREDGELTVPFQYSSNNTVFKGSLFSIITDLDGSYRMVSATKGLLDVKFADAQVYSCDYTSPVLIVGNEEGFWGLVDYNGNMIIPFEYPDSYNLSIDTSGSLVIGIDEERNSATFYDLEWNFGSEEEMGADPAAMETEAEPTASEAETMEAEPAMEPETMEPETMEAEPAETEENKEMVQPGAPEDDGEYEGTTMKLTDLFELILVSQGDWAMETGDIIFFTEEEDGMHFLLTDADGQPSSGTATVTEDEDYFWLNMVWEDGSHAEYGIALQNLQLYTVDGGDATVLTPVE